MSAPPPGFNENNSLLPDVNAQIHVMKGGGNTNENEGKPVNKEEPVEEHIEFSESEKSVLKEYSGLDAFPAPFKREFLNQLNNGICTKDTGDSIILSEKCWAIQQYIQSLIHSAFKKANSVSRTSNITKKEEEKEEKKEEEVNTNMSESLQGMVGKPNSNSAFENNNSNNVSNTDSVVTTNGFGQAKGGSRKSRVNKKLNTYFRRLPTRRNEKKRGTRKQKTRN